jgi:predicted MPP superfamily phosphohydrolase
MRPRTGWIALLLLTGCVANLASGPWPSSSDQEILPLDHPTFERHLEALGDVDAHRLAIFGDQRALADGEWQAIVQGILEREDEGTQISPLLAIVDTGDIVFDGNYRDQFNMLGQILRPLERWPYLVAVGNHEVQYHHNVQARQNVVTFLGPTLDPRFTVDRMYYRKDAPGHHLLFLDSTELLDAADGSDAALDPRAVAQLQWLVDQLSNLDRREFTTVVLHHPFVSSSSMHSDDARELWSLRYQGRTLPRILAEGGVDLVLAGHTHTFERFDIHDDAGHGFSLVNVSGRPRAAVLGFGKTGREAHDLRGHEVEDLRRRGWQDLEGWTIEQRAAMLDSEADQWLELRVEPGRAMVGEVFFLGPKRHAQSGGAFVIR